MVAIELRSLEDLRRHTQSLAVQSAETDPVTQKLRVAKRIVWMFLLSGSFLFYYLLDKMGEAIAILR